MQYCQVMIVLYITAAAVLSGLLAFTASFPRKAPDKILRGVFRYSRIRLVVDALSGGRGDGCE